MQTFQVTVLGGTRPIRDVRTQIGKKVPPPNKRLHPAPRRVLGVGHFVTRKYVVRSNQQRFQISSHFAARVSREPLGRTSWDIGIRK